LYTNFIIKPLIVLISVLIIKAHLISLDLIILHKNEDFMKKEINVSTCFDQLPKQISNHSF